ncbi:Transposase [Granulicella rosea]|uniref:Transposase n=1 Tax=Granulicella rosea TaxID=474952 RepID=A0A239K5C7_9BACT|nr:Transposase [Granulicella rosea]
MVDLLPDRDANTVAAWLRQHPGTEIISRDRGGIYAEAARRAAPRAVQVADRWHLLRNLSEVLRHALAPHHRLFSQAAKACRPGEPDLSGLFLKTGASDQELARQLGIDHRTVKKFRTAELYPEAKPRVRESMVDDYASYLDQRLSEGCRSSTTLWRELRERNFRGQVNGVRYWLRQRRSYRTRPALRTSPRQIVWLILKATPAAKDLLEEMYRKSPEIGRVAKLATSFFASSASAAWRRCRHGLNLHKAPPWPASLRAWKGTSTPCARLSDCRGARDTSRGRSTGSSSSNARCMAALASTSCVCVSFSGDKNWSPHTPRENNGSSPNVRQNRLTATA